MTASQETYFQLKADLVPLTVIKLNQTNPDLIQNQLDDTVKKAPNYFTDAPILIDASTIENQSLLNIEKLVSALKKNQLIPVAIRGLTDSEQKTQAKQLGLATLKAQPEKNATKKTLKEEPPIKNRSPSKIITSPIRAGTQVYARGGDLIILSAVNPGAECFADGSIHVYGSLRGRALAGVNGDTNARIFCRSLDAELIAISGHYQVNESFCKSPNNQGMLEIYLHENKLHTNII